MYVQSYRQVHVPALIWYTFITDKTRYLFDYIFIPETKEFILYQQAIAWYSLSFDSLPGAIVFHIHPAVVHQSVW